MMKISPRLVGVVAVVALLAACHSGQDISFDGRSVSLHANGQPTATITSRGSFSVGSKLINITPAQRQLFLRYYNRVTTIHTDTQVLKKAGWNLAGNALHMAGQSIKHPAAPADNASTSSKAAGTAIQTQAQKMQQRAIALCRAVQQVKVLKNTLSQQVAAFKPYSDIYAAPQAQCTT